MDKRKIEEAANSLWYALLEAMHAAIDHHNSADSYGETKRDFIKSVCELMEASRD